jgi:hypothetical protein
MLHTNNAEGARALLITVQVRFLREVSVNNYLWVVLTNRSLKSLSKMASTRKDQVSTGWWLVSHRIKEWRVFAGATSSYGKRILETTTDICTLKPRFYVISKLNQSLLVLPNINADSEEAFNIVKKKKIIILNLYLNLVMKHWMHFYVVNSTSLQICNSQL